MFGGGPQRSLNKTLLAMSRTTGTYCRPVGVTSFKNNSDSQEQHHRATSLNACVRIGLNSPENVHQRYNITTPNDRTAAVTSLQSNDVTANVRHSDVTVTSRRCAVDVINMADRYVMTASSLDQELDADLSTTQRIL